uniref:Uncharacterized protein n=1 Tax=uncultured organism MedDCM-OCT-S11-C359 TaxID=743661 RepID=D6PLG6_9ZZZZ|nr:hypothetical protein [uncultured organism MedDCM-OCT-S11-C359]
MALSNYSELQSSVANWLNRSDLTTEITGDFIVLTEKDFNSKLRIRKWLNLIVHFQLMQKQLLYLQDFYKLEIYLF